MKKHRDIWSQLSRNLEEELYGELNTLKWIEIESLLMIALSGLFLDELDFELDADLHDRMNLDFFID